MLLLSQLPEHPDKHFIHSFVLLFSIYPCRHYRHVVGSLALQTRHPEPHITNVQILLVKAYPF